MLIIGCCVGANALYAQVDSTNTSINESGFEVIENYIQNNELEGDFENQDIFENLEAYQRNPLNLNKASYAELEDLNLLNAAQINALIDYRIRFGKLISMYELQAVPNFDLLAIKRILPFVKVSGDLDDVQVPLIKMLYQGRNELFYRWQRVLEERDGYRAYRAEEDLNRYLGDPNRHFFRFKHTYENRLSYGITAEKDAGEEFFKGSNKQGFDFYSAHFFLKNYNKRIKALAIGDYAASFGQGLILFSGFGRGKGAEVMSIRRNANTLRGYSSVGEALFYRGAGLTFGLTDNLEVTAFGSIRNRDGNLLEPDTLDTDEQFLQFSSLQTSGLHRTAGEIADKNALQQTSIGGNIKYRGDRFHVAANVLYNQFDKELVRSPRPYNRYYFNGDRLLNASLDYSYIYRNYNFFGETAISDNGGIATLNGLLIGLDRTLNFSILHRHFEKEYQALNPAPFAETSNGANETGLYLGLQYNPNRNWTLQGYYDFWKHPYFRFRADAPSSGYEYLVKISYKQRRKLEAYTQFRFERKQENAPDPEAPIDYLLDRDRVQLRVHLTYHLSPVLTLKSRAEYALFDNHFEPKSQGFLVYQDVQYKPKDFPVSLTARYALYETDDYDARIYAYENSILYDFYNPAYYNQGSRFYINLRYRGIRNLSLELRYARTFWETPDAIGNGLEEIDGDVRTEVKAQVRYRF